MLHKVQELKKIIRVRGKDLDLSDSTEGGLPSPFESFLETCALFAHNKIEDWGFPVPSQEPYGPKVLTAELLLIKAEIAEEFGYDDSFNPEEVSSGGSEGTKVKRSRMSAEERGEIAAGLRNKAYQILFGKLPTPFEGVA
ncbi:hypothetical protein JWG40_03860 [Leptospira sp. 201903074]|uniref:hypothetical protein n=1 Tax=Leptospira abararensis TaxID=2810036 RepID=UPI001962698F|nr:hypothetical protein [Leptospira abararensis]MBM9546136.1 hypothetical protein [Leptospira abararensis]